MPATTGPFLLFDGHALVHRAFHAMPPLTVSKTGEPVGAVFGVATMLLKAMADYKPSHIAFAFDVPAPTFRHAQFAEYKAHRPPGPDELRAQFGRVHELVSAFGIPIFEQAGYEADDMIGTLSCKVAGERIPCIIVTGDQDTFQLVGDHVSVLTTRKGFTYTALYDVDGIRERFGLLPRQIPDLKALKGDPSDNIKGVPGVGEKTAVKLLQQFGTVEQLLDQLKDVNPAKLRDLFDANRDRILFDKYLCTIVCDVPLEFTLADCAVKPMDHGKLTSLFRELEFRTLVNRITAMEQPPKPRSQVQLSMFGAEQPQTLPKNDHPHTIVRSEADLDRLAGLLEAAALISFDTETDDKDATRAHLVGISLLPLPGEEAFYVPVGHLAHEVMQVVPDGKQTAAMLIDAGSAQGQLPLSTVVDRLRPIFADPAKPKVAHNGKYDMTVLAEHGMPVEGLTFDTMIAAYLLNERVLGLKDLAFSRLGLEMTPITELIGRGSKQLTMAEVAIEPAAAYASMDVIATAGLKDVLEPELTEQGVRAVFDDVDMPLVPVLVDMERRGIAVDTKVLGQLSREIGERAREIELAIYNSIGHKFNINSPSQLGTILFEELKLPAARRTKTGYSTDAQVLEELRGQHPIVDLVLEFRQLTKLKSTYVDALPTLINPRTGRIHTDFNQTIARTGRLSSSNPNLQNIPVRTPLGRRIRQAFIAGTPGSVLLSADYSQIELRILAHITRDPRLVAAFEADEDIHAATAAAIFNVPLDQVTSDQRRVAKTTNFGVIYGISDFGLSERTDLSRAEAGAFIRNYFETYPGIRDYIEKTKQDARNGRVQTLLGRYQTFSEREILAPNAAVRGAAERTAINMPIQGTAAEVIKLAMIKLHQELLRGSIACGLLLQVHDELVLEVDEGQLTALAELVKQVMESAFELSVPLKVEVKAGKNWDQMDPLHV